MPSYLVDVTTPHGSERLPFTIDHDRALGPQITQVIEELRQRNIVLRGGRDDELGVYWMGRELDMHQHPSALGINPGSPIELRMREARAPAAAGDTSLPRGVTAAAILGYVAGAIAWIVITVLWVPGRLTTEYNHLDQITMALVGGIVGAFTLGGTALRSRGVVALGIVAGVLLGGAGSALGASLALQVAGGVSLRGFVVARVVGWGLAEGVAAVALECYQLPVTGRRWMETLAIGLIGGAACGVIFVLPGPSDLWQGLACVVFGVTLSVAVVGPSLWGAMAIVELQPIRRLVPGILGLREWAIHDNASIDVDLVKLGCQQQRVAVYPAATGATLDGHELRQPAFIEHDGVMDVAARRYRVRLLSRDA
jgi:hypothetical protein